MANMDNKGAERKQVVPEMQVEANAPVAGYRPSVALNLHESALSDLSLQAEESMDLTNFHGSLHMDQAEMEADCANNPAEGAEDFVTISWGDVVDDFLLQVSVCLIQAITLGGWGVITH